MRSQPPACNTLFVANLGDSVDEGELSNLFAMHPGFRQLKVLRRAPGQTMAFADFASVECAAAAKGALHGAMLASSGLPMRLEFSRKPWQ